MIILVSGATKTVKESNSEIGCLIVPANRQNPIPGRTWAMDNGAFSGFDELAFIKMLERSRGVPGCRWVACPDKVSDCDETMRLFDHWEPIIRSYGYPIALVCQDGLKHHLVPWDRVDCVFIGGSTSWKLSLDAMAICIAAKIRGKWVHVGRVNTLNRIKKMFEWGVDSIDGTSMSRFPSTYIERNRKFIEKLKSGEV